jgi:hypothetical protein
MINVFVLKVNSFINLKGFYGRDCSKKIGGEIKDSELTHLPYGELFEREKAYSDNDLYKDNHPVFNVSVVSIVSIKLNESDYFDMIYPPNYAFNLWKKCEFTFINKRFNKTLTDVGIRIKGFC